MKTKQDIIQWLEDNKPRFTDMADKIWRFAEVPWKEFKSSKLQADFLEKEGFKITWDLAGMNTSFVAEWGEGQPIIGFVGEYDALEKLSQKIQPTQEPLVDGAPGHGCGHNLLGTAAVAAAIANRHWLESTGKKGVVRYYGCPAEEGGAAKAFMARAGIFDDLDVAFNFHPAPLNYPQKASAVGVNNVKFRFHGISAHAGGSPHLGRSALDAVELMNVGVNYLREHVTENIRIHYVITHGGDLPNVVPPEAEVWYYIRAHKPDEMDDVTKRVRKIAEGAAMMTETTVEEILITVTGSVLSNHYLADLQYEAMKLVGPIEHTPSEKAFAQKINDATPKNVEQFYKKVNEMKLPDEIKAQVNELIGEPLLGINLPSFDEGMIRTGSTDVGDLSWKAPVSMLRTACIPTGVAGHDWGIVAASGMSIGHKGMQHAAKIMALAAMDCYSDPEHVRRAREEFESATKDSLHQYLIPETIQPPKYENPERSYL